MYMIFIKQRKNQKSDEGEKSLVIYFK
jgi:hypothetical protein